MSVTYNSEMVELQENGIIRSLEGLIIGRIQREGQEDKIRDLKKCLVEIDFNMQHVEEYKRRACDMKTRKALGLQPNQKPDYRGSFGGNYARSLEEVRGEDSLVYVTEVR